MDLDIYFTIILATLGITSTQVVLDLKGNLYWWSYVFLVIRRNFELTTRTENKWIVSDSQELSFFLRTQMYTVSTEKIDFLYVLVVYFSFSLIIVWYYSFMCLSITYQCIFHFYLDCNISFVAKISPRDELESDLTSYFHNFLKKLYIHSYLKPALLEKTTQKKNKNKTYFITWILELILVHGESSKLNVAN